MGTTKNVTHDFGGDLANKIVSGIQCTYLKWQNVTEIISHWTKRNICRFFAWELHPDALWTMESPSLHFWLKNENDVYIFPRKSNHTVPVMETLQRIFYGKEQRQLHWTRKRKCAGNSFGCCLRPVWKLPVLKLSFTTFARDCVCASSVGRSGIARLTDFRVLTRGQFLKRLENRLTSAYK